MTSEGPVADSLSGRVVLALGGLTAIVSMAAGCVPSDNAPAPTTATSSDVATDSPTASPSPSRSPNLDLKQRRAGEAVVRYWSVVSQLAADPKADLNPLSEVAADQAFAQQRVALKTYRAEGWVQIGEATVRGIRTTGDASPFTVSACVDVTGVDFIDSSGKSAVAPNRPNQQRYSYQVEERTNGFLVVMDTFKGKRC